MLGFPELQDGLSPGNQACPTLGLRELTLGVRGVLAG